MKHLICLLIDDDAEDHVLFHDAINKISTSIKCLFSFNGKEAIDKLCSLEYKPDLIFLDIRMPLMNGLQFLSERLKFNTIKAIPVYILTDYFNDFNSEAMSLGVKEIIAKPFSLVEWELVLANVLRSLAPTV